MCARPSIALWITLLLLPAVAFAAGAETAPASGEASSVAAPRAEATTKSAPVRGLKPRVRLADDTEHLYGPCPAESADRPTAQTVDNQGTRLADHLALNLNPTRLSSPSEAGRRLGHGNVILRVPISDALDLRTGVRLDYDSSPATEDFAAEATPTIGVGVEF
jgi:hypothetical protein